VSRKAGLLKHQRGQLDLTCAHGQTAADRESVTGLGEPPIADGMAKALGRDECRVGVKLARSPRTPQIGDGKLKLASSPPSEAS
jgi:hypothetical protein